MLVRPDRDVSSQPTVVAPLATDWEAITPLCALCEEGRLYEVEKWIAQGKPIQCERPSVKPAKKQQSPLHIAVSKGFHSLAELLLVNGYNPNGDFHENLSPAVTEKNPSMAKLLLKMGADPLAVEFDVVLETYDRALMEAFLDAGVDPCAGNAVAKALRRKGRPLLGFVKTYLDRFPALRRQVSIALRCFADEGDAKGVSLMLWLGGDPFSDVPRSAWEEDSENSWEETPIETAIRRGVQPIIQAMMKKPIPQDRVQELLGSMGHNASPELVRRLLSMGADPNLEKDGHHMLRDYAHSIGCKYSRTLFPGGDKKTLEAAAILAEAGAKWSLESNELSDLRRSLVQGESSAVIQLIDIFKRHNVMPPQQIQELTRTPAMRSVLAGNTRPYRDPFASYVRPVYTPDPEPSTVQPKRGYWKRHWSQR
jgi:ankyrin repeat protein